MSARASVSVIAAVVLLATGVAAQNRRLGPEDRTTILDARLDKTFSSTTLNSLVLLPFANELDYEDGAMLLGENFLGQMSQKHPEIKIMKPQDAVQLIHDKKLDESYRAFLGTYQNTGVATAAFLQDFGRVAQADGILMGQVVVFGVTTDVYRLNTGLGVVTWSKNKAVVAMQMKLLRCKDGRELWWGAHGVEGQKGENVRDLSNVVGQVFAAFFGRLPY